MLSGFVIGLRRDSQGGSVKWPPPPTHPPLHGLIDGLPSDRPALLAETSGLNSRRSRLLWVDLPFCRYAGLRQTDRRTDDAIPQPAPFCITRRSVSVKRSAFQTREIYGSLLLENTIERTDYYDCYYNRMNNRPLTVFQICNILLLHYYWPNRYSSHELLLKKTSTR